FFRTFPGMLFPIQDATQEFGAILVRFDLGDIPVFRWLVFLSNLW
ncbi:MAG: hypothetical protein GY820_30480, partial [Gammaproteobacteria bacterium]|nr:hypothetical protein [Gammaproteobacteria bacterium]